jgi:acetylornithine/succinyldiaminopimelate/putrescine aminotransferase
LVLEPVTGEDVTYRRVGIAGKVLRVSEEEYGQLMDFDPLHIGAGRTGKVLNLEMQTVTIIRKYRVALRLYEKQTFLKTMQMNML